MNTLDPVAFFFEHGTRSHYPDRETPEEGWLRGARKLAAAEEWARTRLTFSWTQDDEDSSSFSDEKPAWPLWLCSTYLAGEDRACTCLGGIDFGRGNSPWDQAYKRVVEAELAYEVMSQKNPEFEQGQAFRKLHP